MADEPPTIDEVAGAIRSLRSDVALCRAFLERLEEVAELAEGGGYADIARRALGGVVMARGELSTLTGQLAALLDRYPAATLPPTCEARNRLDSADVRYSSSGTRGGGPGACTS